jgi:uncharacterized protein (TIGR02266 family)
MSLATTGSVTDDEARRHTLRCDRAGVELAVALHVADGAAAGVTSNISPDGVFVATAELLPVGARLLLMLAFPGDRGSLAVRAEVCWARPTAAGPDEGRPAGMGLRFIDPPLGVSLAIADLIEAQRLSGGPIF